MMQRAAPRPPGLALAAYLMVGGVIAWLAPFDRLLDLATLGAAPLRVGLIWALTLTGAAAARAGGLEAGLIKAPAPWPPAILAAIAVALWCAACDGFAPRSVMPSDYLVVMTDRPLGLRLSYYPLRAFNEELLYRLFLTSVLVLAFARMGGWRTSDPRVRLVAILVAQMINVGVGVFVAGGPVTLATMVYELLRFIVPGLVWGMVYGRSGFLADEAAHAGAELLFQPLVALALGAGGTAA